MSFHKLIYFLGWVLGGLLPASSLLAQNRTGSVTDTDGVPIAHAQIMVLNSMLGTSTDAKGRFVLSMNEGDYTLSIHALGYGIKTLKVSCSVTSCPLDFVLEAETLTLNEVTVISDGIEKNQISTPVSITALDSKSIAQSKVWQLQDVTMLVPNMLYGDLGVSYQQQIAIRGISVFSENPATATFIDGVNAINIAGNNLLLMDIDKAEVLRGPQGMRYGRNALGGVMHITTHQGSNEVAGGLESTVGNQGLQRYGGYFRFPMIENKLFASAAFQYQRRLGFYYNELDGQTNFNGEALDTLVVNGARLGDTEAYYAHLNIRYLMGEHWQVYWFQKFQLDQSTGPSMYYQAAPTPEFAIDKPYTIRVNDLGEDSRRVSNSALTAKYYGDHFQLTTVGSYAYVGQQYDHIDQDITAFDVAYGSAAYGQKLGVGYPMHSFTHELQVNSNAASAWQWSAGSYAFYQNYDKEFATVYKRTSVLLGLDPGTYWYSNLQDNQGLAFFGELSYLTGLGVTVKAGIRSDWEWRKSQLHNQFTDTLGITSDTSPKTVRTASYQAFSPRVSIAYNPKSNLSGYVSYSRGFRAGGLNGANSQGEDSSFDPEYSDNIELGYKYFHPNHRWSIHATLYYIYWQDLQLDLRTDGENGIWIVSNIGDVVSKGLEMESSIKPLKGLQADLRLGVTHARYEDFEYLDENIKGNQTVFAPSYTGFIGLGYQRPVWNRGVIMTARGELNVVGQHYFDLHNDIEQSPYQLYNLYLGGQYKAMTVNIWVKNILDQKYITYAFAGYFKSTIINRPRSWGITLTYKLTRNENI